MTKAFVNSHLKFRDLFPNVTYICCKAELWDKQHGQVRTLIHSNNHWLIHIFDFQAIFFLEILCKWHFLITVFWVRKSYFGIFVPMDVFNCVRCSLVVVGGNFLSNQSLTNNLFVPYNHDLIPDTINVHLQLKSLMTFLTKPNFKCAKVIHFLVKQYEINYEINS